MAAKRQALTQNRTITVVLTVQGDSSATQTGGKILEGAGTSTATPSSASVAANPRTVTDEERIDGGFVATRAIGELASITANAAAYQFNKYLILKDDYIMQRQYNVARNVVGTISSTLTSAGATFLTATSLSGGNVAIGGIMAAISVAGSVASYAQQAWQNKDQEEIRLRRMDAQLEFTRQRAGWSINAGSIGEDL